MTKIPATYSWKLNFELSECERWWAKQQVWSVLCWLGPCLAPQRIPDGASGCRSSCWKSGCLLLVSSQLWNFMLLSEWSFSVIGPEPWKRGVCSTMFCCRDACRGAECNVAGIFESSPWGMSFLSTLWLVLSPCKGLSSWLYQLQL